MRFFFTPQYEFFITNHNFMNCRLLTNAVLCCFSTVLWAADEQDPVPVFKTESFSRETDKIRQIPLPAMVAADPEWDWLRLDSGEWLKGDLRGMERDEVDFDSDELGVLSLDWDDIKAIYSHRPMSIMLSDGSTLVGIMRSKGDKVTMIGPDQELELSDIIGVAVGIPKERELWTGNVAVGMSLRGGNVEQSDVDVSTRFTRRTAHSTVRLSYVGNFTKTNDIETANDHLADATYDYRLNKDWFLRPFGMEYYQDPFQNIDSQWKFSVGAGYYIIDNNDILWTVAAGPGYQETRYNTVPAGDDLDSHSGTFQISSEYDQDLTDDVDLYWLYEFTASNDATGRGKHHAEVALDIDLISDIDFRIAAYFDHIDRPQPDDDGVIPDNSDYRLTVGLNYDL
ncbi:MAG: DUF481 domain-containing protein [Ketobacter sp.]|nr:MAG: DUF481 domain-containing protein [Ketobacter sp.]